MKIVLPFNLMLDTPNAKFALLAKFKDPGFLFLTDFHSWRVKQPAALASQA
jgi:hypothetical protein